MRRHNHNNNNSTHCHSHHIRRTSHSPPSPPPRPLSLPPRNRSSRPRSEARGGDDEDNNRLRKRLRRDGHCVLITPVQEHSIAKLQQLLSPFTPRFVESVSEFDVIVSFVANDEAMNAYQALQGTELDGTDICVYTGTEGDNLRDQYNSRCYSCVVYPVRSSSNIQTLYQLFKPYSGGKPMQAVHHNNHVMCSFEEQPKALVAQGVFTGYSLQKQCLHIDLTPGFQPELLSAFKETLYMFPVCELVSKSDVLDIFDPYLSLDCDIKECISINRDTSIASIRGFSTRLHANMAYDKGNGIHLKGSEVMVRHRLSDLTLPKESRVFVSNVGDEIVPSDLYTIFKPFSDGAPMQVVIKRSKRYALVGFPKEKHAADAVAVLGNMQVKDSFLYLYLSD